MNGLKRGMAGFFQALPFMLRHGMGWMFLVPLLLWLLFTFGLFQAGNQAAAALQHWAAHHWGLSVPAQDRQGWAGLLDDAKGLLNGARAAVLWVVVKLAILWLFALAGKYVVLVLLSPLMAHASERAEEVFTGNSLPFRPGRWAREVLRGIGMALRNGFLELSVNIAAWAATLFLPLLAPFTAVLLWGVSCWFYGFSMFDYIQERRGLGMGASIRAARQRSGMVLANGALFNLLMKVPLLGMVAAPLLGAVGAVLAEFPPATPPARRP